MPWAYSFSERARKQLLGLDRQTQQEIIRYCEKRLAGEIDPRGFGHGLTGQFRGLWRYRVGDLRIIVRIEFDVLVVVVIGVGSRGGIYR